MKASYKKMKTTFLQRSDQNKEEQFIKVAACIANNNYYFTIIPKDNN